MPEVRPADPVPIYLCVTGPRALDCAGQIADGVVLNAFMPPSYTRRSIARLDAAAHGKYGGELAQCLVVALADTVAEAAARVRPILATYLVYFPNLAAETGLDEEFLTSLRDKASTGGLEATFSDLPDSLVSQHALVGPVAECEERLAAYRDAGLQLPILFPDPISMEQTVRDLARA